MFKRRERLQKRRSLTILAHAILAQVLHLWGLVDPRDTVATGGGSFPVPLETRRVSKTSVVSAFLRAAWLSFATFLNGRAKASAARRTSRGEPRAMCRKGSRRSETHGRSGTASVTDVAAVDKDAGTGRSASRGGSDPRDAEVRALRKQVAELQKKTSAKSSRNNPQERDDAKPLLEKIQASERKLWRPPLRSAHCDGSRRQSSWIHAHRWQLACSWQWPHQFVRSEDARRSWRLWMRSQEARATPGAHARCAGGAQAMGGHDGDAPSQSSCSSISNGH